MTSKSELKRQNVMKGRPMMEGVEEKMQALETSTSDPTHDSVGNPLPSLREWFTNDSDLENIESRPPGAVDAVHRSRADVAEIERLRSALSRMIDATERCSHFADQHRHSPDCALMTPVTVGDLRSIRSARDEALKILGE